MTRFLWGVATSAYQVEGAVENDWIAWETLGKLKTPGVACAQGSGHRERWQSDVDLLSVIGANAYARASVQAENVSTEVMAAYVRGQRLRKALTSDEIGNGGGPGFRTP